MSRRSRSAAVWVLVLATAVAAVILGRPAPARADAPPGQICFFFCPPPSSTTTVPAPTTTLPAPTTTLPALTTTTVPAPTTTTTSPAPTTTTVAPGGSGGGSGGSGGGAALVPCAPEPSGACSEDPTEVVVDYPAGSVPAGVEVSFVTTGRSPAAPRPVSETVVLDAADAHPCPGAPAGERAMCWSWPAGLRDGSYVLNGTYRVTPCSSTAGGRCTTSDLFPPASFGLAAPPQSPSRASAVVSGSQVAVSWSPAAAPEPDLVGYAVSRDGQVVYACTLDGLGPGAGTPCPANLTIADHPGDGQWSYAVTALRLGVDSASADVLTSVPTAIGGSSVTVAGVAGPSSGSGPLVPLPGFAPESSTAGTVSAGGFAPTPVAPATPSAGGLAGVGAAPAPETAAAQNLNYPGDGGVVGKSQSLALKVGEPGPHTDVVPVAVLALGIIALAIAAHFLYLRVELGLLEARRAAGLVASSRPAHRRTR